MLWWLQPVTLLMSTTLLVAYAYRSDLYRLIQSHQTPLYQRAFILVFYHENGLHLLKSIAWVLKLCSHLERKYGSLHLLYTTTMMIISTQGLVLLVLVISQMFTDGRLDSSVLGAQLSSFNPGFSGVLFSLQLCMKAIPFNENENARTRSDRRDNYKPVAGLIVLAALQTFYLAAAHFLIAICGIAVGFLYQRTSRIRRALSVYFHLTISRFFLNLYSSVRNDYAQDLRRRDQSNTVEETCVPFDPQLQWQCHRCSEINGVFLLSCEGCRVCRSYSV
ncbi:hypothetical protein KP509_36G065500 [Ceratopteris richardii]|uniref:RanBP2-type domain-containing protein n=1 Tax=Ceratopteris richardii TaxID=49495 RepID=A0A8T2QEH0_CERRI|nr:hypothetical protein KP509_36G065500 [Ceratopteris richardii]